MPRGGVYNDSISRCDLYSNPYDVRMQSRSVLVKHRAEMYAGSRDMLDSPQRRLERELFLRIQERNFGLATGKFVVVAKVGKYAFMAFALPAYIFCYGLPHWLITFGFPKALNFTKRGLQRFSRVLHSLRGRINPALASFQSQMKKAAELISRIKEAALSRWNAVIHAMRQVNQRFIRPFSPVKNYLSGVFAKLKVFQERLSEIRVRVRHTLIYLPNTLQEKLAVAFQKASEGMKGILQYMAKPFMQIVEKAVIFKEAYQRAVETAQRILREVLDRAIYRPYGKVKEMVNSMGEAASRAYQRAADPVVQWISSRYQSYRKLKDRAGNFKDRCKEKFRERWESFADRVDRALKTTVKSVVSVVQGIVHVFPTPVISLFSIAFFPYRRLYRSSRSIFKKAKRLQEKIAKGFQKISRAVLKGLSYFGQGLEWFIPKVKAAPKKIYKSLKKGVTFFLVAVRGAFYLVRLMLAWVRVLFHYGMILLREWTRSVLSSNG
ncbi:MAG: hypothetical protein K940chlam7_00299 [Chlamydiae bacterium]|nr:hypothetical protein [Chlamydiota bacterium]